MHFDNKGKLESINLGSLGVPGYTDKNSEESLTLSNELSAAIEETARRISGEIDIKNKLYYQFSIGEDIDTEKWNSMMGTHLGNYSIIRYSFDLHEFVNQFNVPIKDEEKERFMFSIDNINKKCFSGYIQADYMPSFTPERYEIRSLRYNKYKDMIILCILSPDNKPINNKKDFVLTFRYSLYKTMYMYPKHCADVYRKIVFKIGDYNKYEDNISVEEYERRWNKLRLWAETEKRYYENGDMYFSTEGIHGRHYFEKLIKMMDLLEQNKEDSNEKYNESDTLTTDDCLDKKEVDLTGKNNFFCMCNKCFTRFDSLEDLENRCIETVEDDKNNTSTTDATEIYLDRIFICYKCKAQIKIRKIKPF